MEKIFLCLKYSIIQLLSLFVKPNKNYWLFSSSYNNNYNYNSKYLFEYVIKSNTKIKCKFIINDDQKRKKLIEKYGKHFIETISFRGMIEALRAGVWFTSAGLPIYIPYSKKNRYIVNLWHGVPLKKIGLKENNFSLLRKLYFKLFFSHNYSIITTSSHYMVDTMADSFGVGKEKVKVLGQPRNDLLGKYIDRDCYLNEHFKELPIYKEILLYAPTYREFNKTQLFPFHDFDKKKLDEFLEQEKIIIFIRMHQSEINEEIYDELKGNNRIRFINNDIVEDVMEVLSIFDLLLTDYSSIYIDHLILEKPQLFIPYDLDEYINLRGLNFEYNRHTPGPKVKSFNELTNEISKLLSQETYYKDKRDRLNNYFNQVQNNNCENIFNYVKENLWER